MKYQIKSVKIRIDRLRYVKVCHATPGKLVEDDLNIRFLIKFVRWSRHRGCLIISSIQLSEEAFNALMTGSQGLLQELRYVQEES